MPQTLAERQQARIDQYTSRARALLLSPTQAAQFLTLNRHADAHGVCPGCGTSMPLAEHVRVSHARSCPDLRASVAASLIHCHACGAAYLAGTACQCHDGGNR